MLPVGLPGVSVGGHVEVFDHDGNLVHSSRPDKVCSKCGADYTPILVPTNDGMLCLACTGGRA